MMNSRCNSGNQEIFMLPECYVDR